MTEEKKPIQYVLEDAVGSRSFLTIIFGWFSSITGSLGKQDDVLHSVRVWLGYLRLDIFFPSAELTFN